MPKCHQNLWMATYMRNENHNSLHSTPLGELNFQSFIVKGHTQSPHITSRLLNHNYKYIRERERKRTRHFDSLVNFYFRFFLARRLGEKSIFLLFQISH